MEKRKLIFLDIDGTLTEPNRYPCFLMTILIKGRTDLMGKRL